MSNDLNLCIFIGRLGKDPEKRSMPDGKAVVNFDIAVGKSWIDKPTGEKKETTTWVPVVAFERLAEVVGQYLHKGSKVFIAGEFRVRKWEDKEGKTRYNTEVVANKMQMLDSKPAEGATAASTAPAPKSGKPAVPATGDGFEDDDIPF